jgi:hypothetical protein
MPKLVTAGATPRAANRVGATVFSKSMLRLIVLFLAALLYQSTCS